MIQTRLPRNSYKGSVTRIRSETHAGVKFFYDTRAFHYWIPWFLIPWLFESLILCILDSVGFTFIFEHGLHNVSSAVSCVRPVLPVVCGGVASRRARCESIVHQIFSLDAECSKSQISIALQLFFRFVSIAWLNCSRSLQQEFWSTICHSQSGWWFFSGQDVRLSICFASHLSLSSFLLTVRTSSTPSGVPTNKLLIWCQLQPPSLAILPSYLVFSFV